VYPLHPFRRGQESGALTRDAAATTAAAISVVAHPFLLSPLTVALVSRSWRWAALIAVTMTLPLTLVILRKMRRGSFSDFDVSSPTERPGLYRAGFLMLAVATALMYFLHAPAGFLRANAALAIAFGIGYAGNRWLKTSLHMMIAAFCGVLVAKTYPGWIAVPIVVLAALAWSRWRLKRHTPLEIAAGLILGILAGLYTIR
jgi:hypothetical protein